ncbi:hypothetical protein J4209_06830 [Candidatus Woesearchaeota archaeon]|nr:hypothetical protein [Candidatus Woesearchaeota archaeon]
MPETYIPVEVGRKITQAYYNSLYADLIIQKAKANSIIHSSLVKRFNGCSEVISGYLHLGEVVEAFDMPDALETRDLSGKSTTILYSHSPDRFVVQREISKHPPIYSVTLYLKQDGTLIEEQIYGVEGANQPDVKAAATEISQTLQEAIKKDAH